MASTVVKEFIDVNANWDVYLGVPERFKASTLLTDVLTFTILYNYIVPISLYVSIGKFNTATYKVQSY